MDALCDKIYTIDEIRAIASPIAKSHGVAALYLFGSYARGDATSDYQYAHIPKRNWHVHSADWRTGKASLPRFYRRTSPD